MPRPAPKASWTAVLVLVAFFPAPTRAQSPGPREFLNIPVRQTVAYIDYVSSSAESFAANLALPNNVTASNVISPTALVSFPLNNKYAGLSLSVPYSKVEITGANGTNKKWGFNDPAIGFHKNIFGLPAYKEDEFSKAVPQTFMSFHFTFNPPSVPMIAIPP